jgi:hypothetical protein
VLHHAADTIAEVRNDEKGRQLPDCRPRLAHSQTYVEEGSDGTLRGMTYDDPVSRRYFLSRRWTQTTTSPYSMSAAGMVSCRRKPCEHFPGPW